MPDVQIPVELAERMVSIFHRSHTEMDRYVDYSRCCLCGGAWKTGEREVHLSNCVVKSLKVAIDKAKSPPTLPVKPEPPKNLVLREGFTKGKRR